MPVVKCEYCGEAINVSEFKVFPVGEKYECPCCREFRTKGSKLDEKVFRHNFWKSSSKFAGFQI